MQWMENLAKKNVTFGGHVKRAMLTDFTPTVGKIYEVRIIRGESFKERCRNSYAICDLAQRDGFGIMNLEAVCQVCDCFSGEELAGLGLHWLIAMMDPHWTDHDMPVIAVSSSECEKWLSSYSYEREDLWAADSSFGFVKQ